MIAAAAASFPNTRRAHCARCSTPLLPGQGRRLYGAYHCQSCAGQVEREEWALTEASQALAIIGVMLNWSRPLGFEDEERVRKAVRQHPETAPARASEIAWQVISGKRFTVWEVVAILSGNSPLSNK